MKLHPRRQVITRAACDLSTILENWAERHDLTDGETLMCLTEYMNRFLQYVVRGEWYPEEASDEQDERASEGEGREDQDSDEEDGASVEGSGE